MKITVTTLSDEIFSLDVSEDLELENFKVCCEIESGIPSTEILINHNGKPLMENRKTLKALGIVDGDVVILQRIFSSANESASNTSTTRTQSGSYSPYLSTSRSIEYKVPYLDTFVIKLLLSIFVMSHSYVVVILLCGLFRTVICFGLQ